jgi:branched-chain amino acid transport system ATP-binding protein
LPEASQMLTVENLVTGYGKKQVLNGVSLHVSAGEVVALVGHNGAGKSTLLKAAFGLLPVWQGQVSLDGKTLNAPNLREMLRAGVAYVPQGNRVFTDLTVRENLEVAGTTLPNKASRNEGIERGLGLFPALRPRLRQRAGTLSGGEKQLLALANALVVSPRLLLMDEPSLGLAPQLVTEALRHVADLNRDRGVTVLIVEQKVREVLKMAGRVYVLRTGSITFSGPTGTLDDDTLRRVYL